MSATIDTLKDAQAALAANGITASELLAHPYKQWDAEAIAFLQSVGTESQMLKSALRCVELGWYVFSLGERSKAPDNEFAPNGFKSSTNDIGKVRELWTKKPNNNIGIDLGRSNLVVLDFDSGRPPMDLNLPNTLQVATARGTHVYYSGKSKQGKLHYQGQPVGDIKSDGGYVLAPFSVHPSGPTYEIINRVPVVAAPDLEHFRASKTNGMADEPRNTAGKIPHGSLHGWLVSQAGRMRNAGLTVDEIEPALLRVAYAECEEPLDDSKIIQIARSMNNYESGRAGYALAMSGQQPDSPVVEEVTAPKFKTLDYPSFPKFAMSGTSIYEGFVKPYCEKNSRIDYFMWLPAMAMMLNYLGGKVSVPFKSWMPSIYLVVIGKRGVTNKSTSIKNGMQFFEFASALTHYGKDIKNAESRTLVFEAGSPEGLGTDMQRTNCKNSILFYDEFSSLVAKAGIEGSGMTGALLKMYESNLFANSVKTKKDTYSLAPNSYTTSLIAANTTQTFGEKWGQFAYNADGMEDRFSFLLEPQVLPEMKSEEQVPFIEAALETRKLIDKAVNQKTFEFLDQTPLLALGKKYGNRPMIRAEKWALALAVDLGLDVIDDDCVERGVALVEYEMAVKKYLMAQDAESKMAAWQQEVVRILQYQKDGRMPMLGKHGLRTAMRANRFDTKTWSAIVLGLKGVNHIALTGKGTKADPEIVQLLQTFDGYEGEGNE